MVDPVYSHFHSTEQNQEQTFEGSWDSDARNLSIISSKIREPYIRKFKFLICNHPISIYFISNNRRSQTKILVKHTFPMITIFYHYCKVYMPRHSMWRNSYSWSVLNVVKVRFHPLTFKRNETKSNHCYFKSHWWVPEGWSCFSSGLVITWILWINLSTDLQFCRYFISLLYHSKSSSPVWKFQLMIDMIGVVLFLNE